MSLRPHVRSLAGVCTAAVAVVLSHAPSARAQGTAFTYQGRLANGSAGVTGLYDFQFRTFDASSAGNTVGTTVNLTGVGVTNGLFTVTLDFGANVFTGPARFLDLAAKTNGSVASFVPMTPRQPLTPAPYAIRAASADSVASGSVGNAQLAASAVRQTNLVVTGTPGAGKVIGSDGTGLVWADAPTASGVWGLTGNAGTSSGTQFLGTTDNQPVEFRVNNRRALRLEPASAPGVSHAANVIGGSDFNTVAPGVVGATIAGGGVFLTDYNLVQSNRVSADFGTVGGGQANTVSGQGATIAGGQVNRSGGEDSSVGGGSYNFSLGERTTIAGGYQNQAAARWSTVAGGVNNSATNDSSAVPGGANNLAGGRLSFAAGFRAKATNEGAFVWADSQPADFGSLAENSFNIRASGGVRIITGGAGVTVDGVSILGSGGGTNTVSGQFAVVSGGHLNTASGNDSAVIGGKGNKATNEFAIVGGQDSIAGGVAAIALGNGAKAFGNYSKALGDGAVADGEYSTSIGSGSKASGRLSVAIGGSSRALAENSTVGGGSGNTLDVFSTNAVIAGGYGNSVVGLPVFGGFFQLVSSNGANSTISGGTGNRIVGTGNVIAGGLNNFCDTNSASVISGGVQNTLLAGSASVISGGGYNATVGTYATIPGGLNNVATNYAFAAGRFAKAYHEGSFVWADSQLPDFASTGNNQFLVRAGGGVGINTTSPQATLDVGGSLRVNGGTTFNNLQAGQAVMSSGSANNKASWTITFPKAFSGTPKVTATIAGDPAGDFDDTFVASVRKASPTSCVINIVRVDAATGWGQSLRINWVAWE